MISDPSVDAIRWRRDLSLELLTKQLYHQRAVLVVMAAGVQLPEELLVDLVETVCDIWGLPEDERSWVEDEWEKVLGLKLPVEDFLQAIVNWSDDDSDDGG